MQVQGRRSSKRLNMVDTVTLRHWLTLQLEKRLCSCLLVPLALCTGLEQLHLKLSMVNGWVLIGTLVLHLHQDLLI